MLHYILGMNMFDHGVVNAETVDDYQINLNN